ncbi:DNA topoisomerase IV [Psychroflexus sp. CAK57W]|uniref:DNA topoisomerase IV n=1 Tax=Psychroflexus curvus TaxID=2873595 RepID=UPI001CD00398|nr:DNA topoisomerase IV [Psychroflexus curvus]MBZ9626813.1 DNA topoisomerase IV [Psychroflexus curvus]MBZ9786588.1 DNA topoisomerase IV [Psychroflexus curvus]
MRHLILLTSLSLCLASCYNPERECKDFKTGKFEFETYLDGDLVKTTFIRNDSIEIEIYENKKDTASIRWINDCEYVLKSLNPKNMAEEKPIHMKILSTSKNSYTFEYSIVGKDKKQKGRVTKVN